MSTSMNLQFVLNVLVTGRVSHVRVVASEMPGGLPVGEPRQDLQLGDCHIEYGLPKPRWKCIGPRAGWYHGRKIYGAANNLLREPGNTLL